MAGTISGRTPVAVARALDGLGRDVTTWRKLRHLTVEQVADRAGLSRSTVLRLEAGRGASLATRRGSLGRWVRGTWPTKALDPYATDVGPLRADGAPATRVRARGADR